MSRFFFGICGLFTVIELCCCMFYFNYIYSHDNSIANHIISQGVLHNRNRTTAISMVGQMTCLAIELVYTALVGAFITLFKFHQLRGVAAMIKIAQFFLIPLIEIFTSSPLRNYLKSKRS